MRIIPKVTKAFLRPKEFITEGVFAVDLACSIELNHSRSIAARSNEQCCVHPSWCDSETVKSCDFKARVACVFTLRRLRLMIWTFFTMIFLLFRILRLLSFSLFVHTFLPGYVRVVFVHGTLHTMIIQTDELYSVRGKVFLCFLLPTTLLSSKSSCYKEK